MSETAYWVWLQCALGEGAAVQPLLEEFGSAKAVYDANIMEWRMTPALTKYQVQHLESTPLSAADKVLSTCKQQGWQVLPYDHPDYPRLLRDLPDPPLVLYVDGTVPDWNRQLTLGIVGTARRPLMRCRCATLWLRAWQAPEPLWSAAAHWESTVPPIRARCWPAAPPLRCWAAVWVPGI